MNHMLVGNGYGDYVPEDRKGASFFGNLYYNFESGSGGGFWFGYVGGNGGRVNYTMPQYGTGVGVGTVCNL